MNVRVAMVAGVLAAALSGVGLLAQEDGRGHEPQSVGEVLPGFWRGAYVLGESVQPVTLTITREGDAWRALPRVPEWPGVLMETRDVDVDADGRLSLDMPWGRATLRLDLERRELVGRVGEDPTLGLHLKRMLRPPPQAWTRELIEVEGLAGTLSGTVVRPRLQPAPWPGIVWITGRGCWDGASDSQVRRAQLLAEHGVASLVVEKRGTGRSGGDCATATHDDLVADALAALDAARAQAGFDPERVGLQGSSAGGWIAVAAAAAAEPPPAFVVTVVGPSTSVEQQQRDNARLIARDLGLSGDDLAAVDRYQDLMFDASVEPAAAFAEMRALLEHARETGWIAYHEETDIPTSADAMDALWVRRFAYDPADDLRAWQGPLLAILGGRDRVVPSLSNKRLYERLFAEAGNERGRVRILPLASHGMWIPEGPSTREDGTESYGFERLAAGLLEEVLVFLEDNELLDV